MTPRVGLVAHRLASSGPTGVGRYALELSRGVAAVAGARLGFVVATPREAASSIDLPPEVERRMFPGPRKAVTLAWALTGRVPRVDRTLRAPNLVHALHAWAPVPARAPIVVTVHDVMPLRHPGWYGRVERWSFERGVQHARDHARLVIADTETEAAAIVEQAGIERDRIRVVPLGVGEEFRRRPGTAERAQVYERYGVDPGRYLVAVGAVSERKNLGVVLRAIAALDPAVLGERALVIAGPRWSGAELVEREVERLGLTRRVHFAGFVATDDLPTLVGSALALVHPSRDEGFGLTPLEAMAAGVPVISGNGGSLPEIVGSAGLVLDCDDADAWAGAIAALAVDESQRAALVEAGERHQARFTWTEAASATVAVYDEILGSAP